MGSPASSRGSAEQLPPPTFNSSRPQYRAGPGEEIVDGASVGYFAIGDIQPPNTPPGPADIQSNHFYPALNGSSAFFPNGGGGVNRRASASYGRSDRSGVTRSMRSPEMNGADVDDNRWQMAAGAVLNRPPRPTLLADDGDSEGEDEFAKAVTSLLAKQETLASYTDPAKSPDQGAGATPAPLQGGSPELDDDNDDWEADALSGGNWGDNALPEADGDFPTLRAATMKSTRPSLEPGYAMPTEADVGVIEPMEVHFASQRDTVKTPDALAQMLQRPSLNEDEPTADSDRVALSRAMTPTLPTIVEQHGTADQFVQKDKTLVPTASFIQGMQNIEKMPPSHLFGMAGHTIAEEPGAGPGGGAAWE